MASGPTRFDWDAGNRGKCQKHGLSIATIEHVLAHSETFIVPSPRSPDYEPRFIAIGRTPEGRYALVIFTPRDVDGQSVWRPISARPMHKKEIARYEKEISSVEDR
jgi:uncharacterized protein